MNGELLRFPYRQKRLSTAEARTAAEALLSSPMAGRLARARELGAEDPEVLLAICDLLHSRIETSPSLVGDESVFFYEFLYEPTREIGSFDEREYFLGEFALMAGAVYRVLSRREESARWLDRAEANYVLAQNAGAHVARVAYQRLALRLEEHRFDEVLEFAPVWANNFISLGLKEDALKCRFLEALSLWEMGNLQTASALFLQLASDAAQIGSLKLEAQAANNAAILYGVLGDAERALEHSEKALPLLLKLHDRVGLAKLQWGIGNLLRAQRRTPEAIAAFRTALERSREIGMRGDVAALHLIIADLLLETGQDRPAEWEIRAALPIIEEEKMVPEGMAALTLLRESLRCRQINRQALRELHGYFQDNA